VMELALSQSLCQSKRSLAACSEAARSDPLLVAVAMLAAARFEAVRLESGKFDPAPALAETSAPVSSGKSAIYVTTFGHPVENPVGCTHYTPDSKSVWTESPTWFDAGSSQKVTRYFHGTCRLRLLSEPPEARSRRAQTVRIRACLQVCRKGCVKRAP